ncbi:MAG: hypothetical protein AAF696_11060 [Bacteroidota bacterium]
MRNILVLLFALLFSLPAWSTDCLIYERELEGYFNMYESGEIVDLNLIERLNRKCVDPSDKFSMIYYYFLAVDAYHSNYLTDEEAYEQASVYYDRCSEYFSSFDWTSRNSFIEEFYTRAEGLEVVLADLAYDLEYDRRDRIIHRSRGGSASPWKKGNIIRFAKNTPKEDPDGRSQEDRPASFSKNYWDGKNYQNHPNFTPNPVYDEDGEPYGYVGNIAAINPIAYLKYRGNRRNQGEESYLYAYSDEREAAYAENTRVSRGNYSQANRGQDTGLESGDLIGVQDRVELMDTPGGAISSSGDYLGFGEYAYRVPAEKPVVNGGKSYLRVEVAGGKRGWVPSEAIVEKGELAVLLENTRGILRINMREAADRNAVLFNAGELVVLEDYRDKMVKAVSRNGNKSAWIQDIGNISIEKEDIQIASLLHAALNNYSGADLRSQLEAIKFIPGYADSPISRIVADKIRYLGN